MTLPLRFRPALSRAVLPVALLLAGTAEAAEPSEPVAADSEASRDATANTPIVAYTYAAHGVQQGTVGGLGYGSSLTGNRKATFGGGGMVWGAPLTRLTLVGDFARDVFGNFAPSAAAIVPLLGDRSGGFSLAALGKFKVEGFAMGPNKEVESELETGLLLGYDRAGWHLDLNAITGFGLGDDGEIDTEGRLRVGYDVTSAFRLGLDGQGRYRLNGTNRLPGNRSGDFVVGPQAMLGSRHLFGALTAGPTSMGITDGDRAVGFSTVLSVGGTN
jgi:hypothetical protein